MYTAIQADAAIVAFNLPFDLSRLVVEYRVARGLSYALHHYYSFALFHLSEVSRFSCMKLLGVSAIFDYAGPSGNSR